MNTNHTENHVFIQLTLSIYFRYCWHFRRHSATEACRPDQEWGGTDHGIRHYRLNVSKLIIITLSMYHYLLKFCRCFYSEKVKVFFWNELGTEFEQRYQQPLKHPRIIIISSCRIYRNQTNGEIEITNMPETTFLLNANNDNVRRLRKRYGICRSYIFGI